MFAFGSRMPVSASCIQDTNACKIGSCTRLTHVLCNSRCAQKGRGVLAGGKDKRKVSKLFLLDVHPLCYDGHKPRPSALVEWIRLLFLQVTHGDPIIAVSFSNSDGPKVASLLSPWIWSSSTLEMDFEERDSEAVDWVKFVRVLSCTTSW